MVSYMGGGGGDMFPTMIMRLTSQHRAMYCYLVLSVWIFLLLGGMYKYIGTEDISISVLKHASSDLTTRSFSQNIRPDIKARRVLKVCNSPEMITAGSEGKVNGNYSLEGVLVLVRHGDRGPLTHIRNISSINCAGHVDSELPLYESYIENVTGTPFLYQFLGAFHGFPLMPGVECALGQLTRVGISQLLATGKLLRSLYIQRLGLLNTTSTGDIVVYSTRYRRTIQSGVALLFSLLTSDGLHNVVLKESQSMSFCFDDCACPAIDIYYKKFLQELSSHIKSHPAVMKLVRSAANVVYEMLDKHLLLDPYALKDALLTYVCHGAKLPCLETYTLPDICVRTEHVTGLFAYVEWEARQYPKSVNLRRACLLRAYGLLKNIVMYMLKIMSEKRPKMVIYSGHDKTILYLATALGLITDATASPHYASRFIIEIYKNNEPSTLMEVGPGSDYFFRIVYNGKDLTHRLHFCKSPTSVTLSQNTVEGGGYDRSRSRRPLPSKSPVLCPIESIIRFLHDDYFTPFNATNLKDACIVHTN